MMLNKILYLIQIGDAVNAGQWARKLASEAFHQNYSLRVYANCDVDIYRKIYDGQIDIVLSDRRYLQYK